MGPLSTEAVRGHRDHQHVAHLTRLAEVADVPDVEQVEDAVAVHDPFALFFQVGNGVGELVKGENFLFDGHAGVFRAWFIR